MELKNYFAQDGSGNVMPGAQVDVFFPGTTTRAQVLQNASGGDKANPFYADSKGLIQFAAPNGLYDLKVTGGMTSYTIRVQCADLSDSVAEAEAIVGQAATSASESAASALEAAGSVSLASAEADRAELAADNAFVNAGLYADTTAGLAGTAEGEQFQVLSEDGTEYIRYRHDAGGSATELPGRYPSARSVKDVEERQVRMRDGSDFLELAADGDGNLFRKVDGEGLEYLPHLDAPVQDEIRLRSGKLGGANPGDDLDQAWDSQDNLYRRTDGRGALYITGGRGHVQHFLRQPLARDQSRFGARPITARDGYAAITKGLTASLQQQMMPFIEPPPLLVPNSYDLPDALLSAISLSDDNPVAQLPFPYGKGGSVHPFILPLRRPLYGYRYLLTDSSHLNGTAAEETPILFGTNDLIHYDLIPDVPQPLVHSSPGTGADAYDGFNSDPWFSYDPTDGALIWGARDSISKPAEITEYMLSKTYDGCAWTPVERFSPPPSGGHSPSVLYDPTAQLWRLWDGAPEGVIRHFTGPSCTGPWTLLSTKNFQVAYGIKVWHHEVKYVGSRFAICCNSRDSGTNTDAQVYLGFSVDGTEWTMSPGLVQPQSADIYKPSFFPEFDGENIVRLVFFWSHWDWISKTPAADMQLYVQTTEWIDLTTL